MHFKASFKSSSSLGAKISPWRSSPSRFPINSRQLFSIINICYRSMEDFQSSMLYRKLRSYNKQCYSRFTFSQSACWSARAGWVCLQECLAKSVVAITNVLLGTGHIADVSTFHSQFGSLVMKSIKELKLCCRCYFSRFLSVATLEVQYSKPAVSNRLNSANRVKSRSMILYNRMLIKKCILHLSLGSFSAKLILFLLSIAVSR